MTQEEIREETDLLDSSIQQDLSLMLDGQRWNTWTDDAGELRFAAPEGEERVPAEDLDHLTRMRLDSELTKAYGELFAGPAAA